MNETITQSLIDNDMYSKYLDEVKEYYTLKEKYMSNKNSFINKIISQDNSIDVKKKLFSKQQYKCINCKQSGGTIFNETNKMLKAICGNVSTPCSLKIEIVKMSPLMVNKEMLDINYNLNEIKKSIILTKLDFLFNYIEEDKAIENFDALKEKLNLYQEKYNEIYFLYKNITHNDEYKDILNLKNIEHNNLVNEYKEFINIYKNSSDIKYLREAVNLYISKIIDLDKNIIETKYKHLSVYNCENINKLVQEKYNIKDLELIKKPNN